MISLPWIPPVQGPVLLIDLWSGYSGAAIALLSLGVKCYILAAESNPDRDFFAENLVLAALLYNLERFKEEGNLPNGFPNR